MLNKTLIFMVLISQLGSAQTNRNAKPLVAEISNFAGTGKSWKAEGNIAVKGINGQRSLEEFSIAYQASAPVRARFEITSGANPLLRVCDGESQWMYYPQSNGYVKVMLPQFSPCAYPINTWPYLPITLHSPVFGGSTQTFFEGRVRDCLVIRGTFGGSAEDPRHRILDMCVDPIGKIIHRFQMEELAPKPKTETITFSSILRDEKLDADLFQFHAPEGSIEVAVINWLDPIAQPNSGAFRVSNDVTAPLLVHLVLPTPAGDAAQKLSGRVVVLSAEVNSEGIPQNIKIVGSLGRSPDERAVDAVKQWRFEPGTKNGKPVTVVTALAVSVPTP